MQYYTLALCYHIQCTTKEFTHYYDYSTIVLLRSTELTITLLNVAHIIVCKLNKVRYCTFKFYKQHERNIIWAGQKNMALSKYYGINIMTIQL